ncbi:hypothetical protein [Marivita hallyeonensis]|uniref:Uncharacterized protein n=1 Tax=Marivita hallyeonensis TaxID=996342 RepID=A0A1M5VII8_9RHOB|nr:hypothetical protein [Marivita hallyeonensis]SHH75066.1 hypothetical protein SAMN05443551_2892 [Marivita hallyeonensis]
MDVLYGVRELALSVILVNSEYGFEVANRFQYSEPTEVCLRFAYGETSAWWNAPPEGTFYYQATGLETGDEHKLLFLAFIERPGPDIRFDGRDHCIEKDANEPVWFSVAPRSDTRLVIGLH